MTDDMIREDRNAKYWHEQCQKLRAELASAQQAGRDWQIESHRLSAELAAARQDQTNTEIELNAMCANYEEMRKARQSALAACHTAKRERDAALERARRAEEALRPLEQFVRTTALAFDKAGEPGNQLVAAGLLHFADAAAAALGAGGEE